MAAPETMEAYLAVVLEQIRWKRARPALARELERHLTDQRDAFIKEGKPAEEAERMAVADMGDPVEVGAALDAVHRPRPQWGLLAWTLALAAACTALRLVLTAGWHYEGESPLRALLALLLGTGALLGLYFLDISRLARHAGKIYIGTLALGGGCILQACWAPASHAALYGYRFSYYYLSLFLPLVYALWVYVCRGRGWPGLLLAIAGGIPLMFISDWWYPSMVNLLVLVFSGFALMLCAAWGDWFGVRRSRGTAAVLGISALLGGVVWVLALRHMARLGVALHPEQDPLGAGWLALRLREFLQDIPLLRSPEEGASAILGVRSPLLATHMDEVLGRDFFPAMLAVRFGWLALILLLAATLGLVLRLALRALKQKNRAGRLIALAAALALGTRALLSTILNLGFVLYGTGFPLLAGNRFMVADMALIGLALSAFRGDGVSWEEAYPPPRRRIKRIRLQVEYR